ncbi:MAG: ERF family protein [Mesorhizobium sp.]|uniref:ERF family protein n=1 Tax=Mesorhizobium sp. TaxID=1871066 RepID=UPI000FE579C1|nr:ERF family protein [Mesorhizobium sp.]RWL14839.1 MAG: ERF family protein [Mesorhizobium sp.]
MNTAANALVEHDPNEKRREIATAPAGTMTPMEMAYHLIQNGADLGSVKEMLAMSKDLAADQARRAFDAAVADAKSEIPIVGKNAEGHNKKRYADFSAYAAALKPILAKHGLSYRFRSEQTDRITVTCVLSHKEGHSEENSLSGPADSTGSKNAIQAIGSTLTYLQRYTLIQALGLAASEDDDGQHHGEDDDGLITAEQRDILLKLIGETGTDVVQFCKWAKVEAVADLLSRHYDKALGVLQQRKAKAS